MQIWYKKYSLENLTDRVSLNMLQHVGIEFIELGDNFLKAKMPVDHRTQNPTGILHGGASCVLAETLGSCASYLCVNPDTQQIVGIEINANHLKSITSGYIVGITTPIHVGRSIHVWDIHIHDETMKHLVCVSRLTTKVLEKK